MKNSENNVDGRNQSALFEKYVGLNGPIRTRALNFSGQTYVMHTLSESTRLYRVFGGKSKASGHWWSRSMPESKEIIRDSLAIKPEWSDVDLYVIKTFPKGTVIYEGNAASKGSLKGGGNQVFIEDDNGNPPTVTGLKHHQLT